MLKVGLEIKKLGHFRGELPRYETSHASGLDVRACLENSEAQMTLAPMGRVLIPTGLSLAIPEGYEIQVRPRSGWAFKEGLTVLNSPGTIDADYRGELKILVINLGEKPIVIKDQERVAQLVLAPVVQADFKIVETLSETVRGAGGFGSTGRAENLTTSI